VHAASAVFHSIKALKKNNVPHIHICKPSRQLMSESYRRGLVAELLYREDFKTQLTNEKQVWSSAGRYFRV